MASVPAEANATVPATTGNTASGEARETRGKSLDDHSDLLFGFNRLSLLRQIGLMVGLAASVALGLAVVLWAQEPSYQPVLGDMSNYNPGEVSQVLDTAGIPYRVEPRSGALLVASDDVYRARMRLAAEGVTENRMRGFELLDEDQGLGTSQFMEQARYRRSLEGELARTISSMSAVSGARVHLAIPKESVFVRDSRKPSASVFIDVFAGRRLEDGQIDAIVNLVAGSVSQLARADVTVVDQSGNLLSRQEKDTASHRIAQQFDYNRRVEEELNNRVNNILSPIIGAGRFRTEVSADLDFSEMERAEELYNPDQRALRSEQISSERRVANAAGGVPGALANQPPEDAVVPEVAGGDAAAAAPGQPMTSREQATRNFEIDRTVSYSRRERGEIKRLSIAVAVDDLRQVNPETGEVSYVPWPAEELDRLTLLVRDAVGYSAARGDSVTVVNTAFAPEQEVTIEAPPFWQQQWLLDLVKPALAFIAILILVLVLVRPTLKNLASGGRGHRENGLGGDDDLDGLEGPAEDSAIKQALGQGDDLLLPGATDGYDRQLNALKGLIADDPARVAQVMRQWVNADE
jgi:flagellar M-ring protein FliF